MLEMLVMFMYASVWIAAGTLCYTSVLSYKHVEIYTISAISLLTAMLAFVVYPYYRKIFGFGVRVRPSGKAVLITGCDSGFGHELAKRFASKRFHVFAACLSKTSEGALTLKKISDGKIHVIQMDVRKDEDVKNAVNYVKSNIGDSRFWAVVNNAGILKGLDIPITETEDFTACFETNTLGVVRVTRAFLPLLMESKGRVVTVTSLLSRISIPHFSAYCMSKFATRAFCEILRQEVHPWGVKVVTIEPEFYQTPIASKSALTSNLKTNLKVLDDDLKKMYNEDYFVELEKSLCDIVKLSSSRLSAVVDDLDKAVCLSQPKPVYQPCRNVFFYVFYLLVQMIPKTVLDVSIRIINRIVYLSLPNRV